MQNLKSLLGFDTETFRIGQEQQAPRIVCLSLASPSFSSVDTDLIGNDDWDALEATCRGLLTSETEHKIGQNIAYDLTVIAANFPHLLPLIFKALAKEQFSDTLIREKLLTLTTTGDLKFVTMPDGSKSPLKFGLDSMVKKYFNKDISVDKNSPDSWRKNYEVFDKMPVRDWPESAQQYPKDDAIYPLEIWKLQEVKRQELISQGRADPFLTESFRIELDFCLRLMSIWGAATDPEMVAVIEKELAEELTSDKLSLLISSGIMRPGTPEHPHATLKSHQDGCVLSGKKCTCPYRTIVATKDSIDTKLLREYIIELAKRVPWIVLRYTNPSLKFPEGQLSTDAEFFDDYAHLDPLLGQYQHRQKLQKLLTTEIPRMKFGGKTAAVVHPQYDCLKETGRTSSFSSKAEEYASFNVQNVDPRVRQCFVPRPGYLLFSVDYSQMELASLAQQCLNLFGHSVMADRINAGVDLHAYTGAQLAASNSTIFSAQLMTNDPQEAYMMLLKQPDDFRKHWRKFAKPTNLGYPGGLGAKTFIKFAKGYDVEVDEEMAKTFRELWKQTYPEMIEYFQYINSQCIDTNNRGYDSEIKEQYDLYAYTTPFGLYRAGCDYCAAANGLGLQSFSADGANTGVIFVTRACYNTPDSILYPTTRPWGFIHDELVGEVLDDGRAPERVAEIGRLMQEAMQIVTPDVVVKTHGCLMRRWDKNAEPVFDKEGRLTIWEPKQIK